MDLFRSPGIAPSAPLPPSTFGPGSHRRYGRRRASRQDAGHRAEAPPPYRVTSATDVPGVDQEFEEFDFD